MGRIFDVTLPIHRGMALWPGDPPVAVVPVTRVAAGDASSVSALHLGTHTGTHVDPPFHFLAAGATVDQLPLEVLVGPAVVVSIPRAIGCIEPADLAAAAIRPGDTRVLFKTDNSLAWDRPGAPAPEDYVALSAAAAAWLVARGVWLVGVDGLSVEAADSPGNPVHHRLLSAGVVVVEGLALAAVPPGRYQLACLPLKILGGDGAPARVVLVED